MKWRWNRGDGLYSRETILDYSGKANLIPVIPLSRELPSDGLREIWWKKEKLEKRRNQIFKVSEELDAWLWDAGTQVQGLERGFSEKHEKKYGQLLGVKTGPHLTTSKENWNLSFRTIRNWILPTAWMSWEENSSTEPLVKKTALWTLWFYPWEVSIGLSHLQNYEVHCFKQLNSW